MTLLMGAISFPFTQLLFSDLPGQIAAAAVFGSIALVVQFLIDFEHRLGRVEDGLQAAVKQIRETVQQGFARVNDATELVARMETAGVQSVAVTKLVSRAAAISPHASALVRNFVHLEVDRVSELLRGLTVNEATYDGEDQDWLLNLTKCVTSSIDAISIPEVDAAGNTYHSFWASPMGVRYLDTQRASGSRGVRIRRVFVTTHDNVGTDSVLHSICQSQVDSGIEVRLLYPSAVPPEIRGQITDFILFDDEICYESHPAPHVDRGAAPMILSNHLELRHDRLQDRIDRYRIIWESASPWDQLVAPERVLTAVPDES
ncbi:MAG: hypothetical protein WBA97_01420 [Actinophytocola sp.]|uniref:hypothetical protein n=1 Tax=Actinophytocola sp. TaxID=1872138 RepID=UPI003C7683EE